MEKGDVARLAARLPASRERAEENLVYLEVLSP